MSYQIRRWSFPLTIIFILTFIVPSYSFDQDSNAVVNEAHIKLEKSITLYLKKVTFEKNKHKITYCQLSKDWLAVCLIDGKPVIGTDWEIPKSQLAKATVNINGKTVELDVSCMFDPWSIQADSAYFWITKVEGGYIVHGGFSDGAGAYEAEWLVIKNSSVRIKLLKSEEC